MTTKWKLEATPEHCAQNFVIREHDGETVTHVARVSNRHDAEQIAKLPDLLAENEALRSALKEITNLVDRSRIQYLTNGRLMPEADQQVYIEQARAALARKGSE